MSWKLWRWMVAARVFRPRGQTTKQKQVQRTQLTWVLTLVLG
jgi:hypothetical protein